MSEPTQLPGWYPISEYQQRYWDGANWTEKYAPLGRPTAAEKPVPKGNSTIGVSLAVILLVVLFVVGGVFTYITITGNNSNSSSMTSRSSWEPQRPSCGIRPGS